MAYELYMGNILCPVTPSKIQVKIKNQNKTMNLVNGTEVNVLKDAGLTEISFDLLLPNVNYKFASYKSGFVNAKYFLDEFEKLKTDKKPFLFKLLRTFPNGVALYDTDDMMVSLESYTIKEDVKQGFDVIVSITLKQFKPYGTKIVQVLDDTISVENARETSNSPAPTDNPVTTYTVVEGDCLWNIAKAYYGDGSKYPAIIEANKDKVTASGLIHPGQVLIIPGAATAAKVTRTKAEEDATAAKDTEEQVKKAASSTYNSYLESKNLTSNFRVYVLYASRKQAHFAVTMGNLVPHENRYSCQEIKFTAKKGQKINLYSKSPIPISADPYGDYVRPAYKWDINGKTSNYTPIGILPPQTHLPVCYSFIAEEDNYECVLSITEKPEEFFKWKLNF